MEAPPPPPTCTAVVVSAQNVDGSSVPTGSKHVPGTIDVISHRPTCIERHVSVPCDSSASSVEGPLSQSLPRPTTKTPLLADKLVPALFRDVLSTRIHVRPNNILT